MSPAGAEAAPAGTEPGQLQPGPETGQSVREATVLRAQLDAEKKRADEAERERDDLRAVRACLAILEAP